ncbi:MAG TPA: pyridoxal-dependent decarboxylase, partial [Nitriliruptorales bacterium]
AGVERADSLIVDPHKWLFAPFDCAALLYRDPAKGRASHTQKAGYLETLNQAADAGDWNPSDYQVGLSRRARGVPLWFALATHGTDAFASAISQSLQLAAEVAEVIDATPHLDLVERPDLSVVACRVAGWDQDGYQRWSDALLASGLGLVVASQHDFGDGPEPIMRLCFLNPRTTLDHVTEILDTIPAP